MFPMSFQDQKPTARNEEVPPRPITGTSFFTAHESQSSDSFTLPAEWGLRFCSTAYRVTDKTAATNRVGSVSCCHRRWKDLECLGPSGIRAQQSPQGSSLWGPVRGELDSKTRFCSAFLTGPEPVAGLCCLGNVDGSMCDHSLYVS